MLITTRARLLIVLLALLSGHATVKAQTLLTQVNTIGTTATGVPIIQNFEVSVAGTYQVTLTDIGAQLTAPLAPAPLATTPPVNVAVTQGTTVLASTSGTTNGVAQLSFVATPGSYTIRVTGAPGSNPGSGPIGLEVVGGPDNSTIFTYAGALALPPSSLAPTEVVVNTSFTVPSSGSYTIALNDLALPSALGTLTLAVVEPSCDASGITTLCAILTSTAGAAASTTLTLDSTRTYRVFAVGALAEGVTGGLYSVVVSANAGGSIAFIQDVPLGAVQSIGSVSLAAGPQTLALTDFAFPAALGQLAGVLVQNGVAAAPVATAATQAVTPANGPGTYALFALAVPSASGTGSFGISIGPQGGTPAFSSVQVASTTSATLVAFVVPGTVATAGSFQLRLADFGIPVALTSASAALVQGDALIGTPLTAAGSAPATALSAGVVDAIVVAQSASAGGLVGVDLIPAGGGTPLLAATRGVGGAFMETSLAITSTGNYTVTVQDVGFPAPFSTLDVLVTQGTQSIASFIGAGGLLFDATATGTYSINVIAQPSAAAEAGTYGLNVAVAPPAPSVTLSSSALEVAAGGTVTLTWSSENATSCIASNGWSGTLATGGSQTSPAVEAATQFTLTCSGPGGTTAQSVTVDLAPAKSGGGALDAALILGLFTALGLRACFGRCALRSRG